MLALKFAVLQAAGYRPSEVKRMLGEVATPAALRGAEARVKRASDRLDHGAD